MGGKKQRKKERERKEGGYVSPNTGTVSSDGWVGEESASGV